MRRWLTLLVVIAAAAPAPAAAAVRTEPIDAAVHGNFLESTTSGSDSNVLVATVGDKRLRGGLYQSITQPGGPGFQGTGRYVDGFGTLATVEQIAVTQNAEGKLDVTGTWKPGKGTGRYRKAAGDGGTITGTVDPQSGETLLRYQGTLRYDRTIRAPKPAARARRHAYKARFAGIAGYLEGDVAVVVGTVSRLTPGGGLMVLRAKQGVPMTRVPFTYMDGKGTLTGFGDIERVAQPDGSTVVQGRGGRFTRGTGLYRGVRQVKGGGLAGRRDGQTGVLDLSFAGTLLY
jgi:hypothetical protein